MTTIASKGQEIDLLTIFKAAMLSKIREFRSSHTQTKTEADFGYEIVKLEAEKQDYKQKKEKKMPETGNRK